MALIYRRRKSVKRKTERKERMMDGEAVKEQGKGRGGYLGAGAKPHKARQRKVWII